jgi:acetaldehyde dehydrogenase (acetylating)
MVAGGAWADAGVADVDKAGAACGAATWPLPVAALENRAAETNVAMKKCGFEYKIPSLAYQ